MGTYCPAVWRGVLLADPVNKHVAARKHCLWLQCVYTEVPLLLNSAGMQDCNVIANACLLASTDGAPCTAACSVINSCFPNMGVSALALGAEPPRCAS